MWSQEIWFNVNASISELNNRPLMRANKSGICKVFPLYKGGNGILQSAEGSYTSIHRYTEWFLLLAKEQEISVTQNGNCEVEVWHQSFFYITWTYCIHYTANSKFLLSMVQINKLLKHTIGISLRLCCVFRSFQIY